MEKINTLEIEKNEQYILDILKSHKDKIVNRGKILFKDVDISNFNFESDEKCNISFFVNHKEEDFSKDYDPKLKELYLKYANMLYFSSSKHFGNLGRFFYIQVGDGTPLVMDYINGLINESVSFNERIEEVKENKRLAYLGY